MADFTTAAEPVHGRDRKTCGDPAPVALFAYRRPKHLARVIDALRANELSSLTDLYVFSDGPRSESDRADVLEVRDLIKSIDGFASVRSNFHPNNLGLAGSVITGITEVLASGDRVIVVEDDIVTAPCFLRFMNDALDHYEADERVISVHGYVYPLDVSKRPETFFLRDTGCWGWATWRRGWSLFEANASLLLAELERRGLSSEFDFNGSYPFTEMLRAQIRGENSSWAIRFQAAAFLKEKLTLYPGVSLVENIGLDGSGFHGDRSSGGFRSVLASDAPRVATTPVLEDREMRLAFERFFRSLRPSASRRLLSHALRALRSRFER